MKTIGKRLLLALTVFALVWATGCAVFVEGPAPPPRVHFYYYDYDNHPHCCR